MADALAVAGVLGFLAGIIVAPPASAPFFLWVLLTCGVLIGAWLRFRFTPYAVVSCFMLAAILGALVLAHGRAPFPEVLQDALGSEITQEGVVVREPDVRETNQKVAISLDAVDATVLAVTNRHVSVSPGDRVVVSGVLELPEPFETNTGRVFAYDAFLEKDGVSALLIRADIEVVGRSDGLWFSMLRALIEVKRSFAQGVESALPEPAASLAEGMLLGGKQGLGNELLQSFILVGLVHIVVLSGYNITIVAEAVVRAASRVGRRAGMLVAGIVVIAIVLAAGAGAAAVRAGIMAAIALLARITGRTYDAFRALLLAVVLMLLHSPLLLVWDPGFQLSVVATLGLIFGAPLIAKRLPSTLPEFWKELIASTVAAQVAVLPLLLYQTGLLSLVSLPANLLVLPVVPLAMLASFFAECAGMVWPVLGQLLGIPAYLLLSYVIAVAEIGATLPGASVVVPVFPREAVVLSYVLLVLVWWRYTKRPPRVRGSSLSVR